jgi:hypothetical protein
VYLLVNDVLNLLVNLRANLLVNHLVNLLESPLAEDLRHLRIPPNRMIFTTKTTMLMTIKSQTLLKLLPL